MKKNYKKKLKKKDKEKKVEVIHLKAERNRRKSEQLAPEKFASLPAANKSTQQLEAQFAEQLGRLVVVLDSLVERIEKLERLTSKLVRVTGSSEAR